MKLRSLFQRTWEGWSDLELLHAFQQKRKEVYFDALFERYHPLVYNICLNLTANREESKDLTLLVFSSLYSQSNTLKINHFNAWIVTMAKNTCLSHIRNQRKEAEKKEKWWESKKSTQQFMENAAFRRLIYEEELEKDRLFQKSLETLSRNQRQCIDQFFMKGLSYKRIAQENNLTEKQVKSLLQNGKRLLKKEVSRQYAAQKNNAQEL